MYLVTIANGGSSTVIHEWWPSEIKIDSATISREINAIDSFTFDIFPGNPGWGEINAFSTLVKVQNAKNGKIEFEGRVISPVPSMASDGSVALNVTCEGPMGYLNDSQQDYVAEQHYGDTEEHTGLYSFISKLLSVHNAKVEDHKKIYPGNITLQTFETSNGVTKSITRASTWSNLSEKLIGSFGGEMRVRRGSDGKLYLDYAEKLGTTRATAVELGRNMYDAESAPDPSAVVTRLYPYGCKLTAEVEDEDGNITEVETEERLDISSVNGGLKYIDDVVAIQQYGIIEGGIEWDDITVAGNLKSAAQEWLGDNNSIPVSTKVSALDLSLIGLDYDSFSLYDSYPARNALIGLDETAEIVKQTISVSNPAESSFEFGEVSKRLSMEIANPGGILGKFEEFQSQINSSIINVENKVRATSASIKVLEESIDSTVTETVTTTLQPIIAEIDGKQFVLFQSETPGEEYEKENILWIDTTDDNNTPKRWNGTEWVSVSDKAANTAQNAAENALSQAQQAISEGLEDVNGLLSNMDEIIEGLQQTVTTNETNITQMLQNVQGWEFNFQTIQETVTQLGDQVYTERDERLKYIRFIDGEIWLGRDPEPGEDDFKVVISNERIRFLQNNVEVAYISNNQLYITNANITNRLDIGSFYFAPRSNGNTTLRFNG